MFDFLITGHYRVQSRRGFGASTLAGQWLERDEHLLSNDKINEALKRHPQWNGKSVVRLRPAWVSARTGKFETEPDILYKSDFFEPAAGTPQMAENIVDVRKALAKWNEREECSRALFAGESYEVITSHLTDLELAVANEYYLHEAGHCIGRDVLTKYDNGYFRVGDRTAWSLICLEELRADLHAFGFGTQTLNARQAVQVYLYNLALRFGVHRAGVVRDSVAPYGLIPFLLFSVLREVEAIDISKSRGRHVLTLTDTSVVGLLDSMRRCAAIAEVEITALERGSANLVDCALNGARFIKRRLEDVRTVDEFAAVMTFEANEQF